MTGLSSLSSCCVCVYVCVWVTLRRSRFFRVLLLTALTIIPTGPTSGNDNLKDQIREMRPTSCVALRFPEDLAVWQAWGREAQGGVLALPILDTLGTFICLY